MPFIKYMPPSNQKTHPVHKTMREMNLFDLKRGNCSLTEKMIEEIGQLFAPPGPIVVHIKTLRSTRAWMSISFRTCTRPILKRYQWISFGN